MIQSWLLRSSLISHSALVLSVSAGSAGETPRSFDFMNKQVEMIKINQGIRYHTIPLKSPNTSSCPNFISYVYASKKAFSLTTPFYQGMIFNNQRGPYPRDLSLSSSDCRIVINVSKFDTSSGSERQIPLFNASALIASLSKSIDAGLARVPASEKVVTTGGSSLKPSDKAPPGFVAGSDARGVTIDFNHGDPSRDGIGDTGVVFDVNSTEMEYTGILYCSISSCSLYISRAKDYHIEGFKDNTGQEVGMDVIGKNSRLHLLFSKTS